jgi:tRNA threonylcarbamoyladenosine biosynthesis protein TsaE
MQACRLTLYTHGPEKTVDLGRHVGSLLVAGDVVALVGDLGAGKTCLVKGIARGLEVPEESYVRSPSFVILNMYPGRCLLYHLDLYRIQEPVELEDLGYREIFYGDGVAVIEWADKIPTLLPAERLEVHLAFQNETDREITLEGIGERYQNRWEAINRSLSGL